MVSAPPYYLGIDIGTTNAKVVIVDETARIVRSASREYPVDYPHPGWAEQDPAIWWTAVYELLLEVVKPFPGRAQIRVAGVSGQMHGLVALDEARRVIRPAMLWCDQRTTTQCDTIIETCGGLDRLLRLTNNHMITGYTAPKILWLRDHEPDSYARIATVLLPKDYLRFRLTGDLATDVSDASGTGLFDTANRRWSTELLQRLDLPFAWFPPAYESTKIVGHLSKELTATLDLPAPLPVIAGGGDAALQPLGSGLVDHAECLLVVGTGGNVTIPLPANVANHAGRLQIFCSVLPGTWVALGATNAAGESLRWLRNLLRTGTTQLGLNGASLSFDELNQLAHQSPPGANHVFFLPYLLGERCPHPDANARGAFVGLTTNTTLADLVRAIMEGVAFSLRDVSTLLENQGIPLNSCRLAGGGSQSKLWRNIFSNTFGCPVSTVASSAAGTAYGTALLAGLSDGQWGKPGALKRLIPAHTTDVPDPALTADQQQRFSRYRRLYPALAEVFATGARLD